MADIHIEMSGDICVVKMLGKIGFNDIADTIKAFYPSIKGHVIWDMEKASLEPITTQEFRQITVLAKEHSMNRLGAKTAHVANKKITYGLSRMYTTYAEILQTGTSYNVFETFEDAYYWVTH